MVMVRVVKKRRWGWWERNIDDKEGGSGDSDSGCTGDEVVRE